MYWYRDNELCNRIFRSHTEGNGWMIVKIYESASGIRAVYSNNGDEVNILVAQLDGEFVGPIETPS